MTRRKKQEKAGGDGTRDVCSCEGGMKRGGRGGEEVSAEAPPFVLEFALMNEVASRIRYSPREGFVRRRMLLVHSHCPCVP